MLRPKLKTNRTISKGNCFLESPRASQSHRMRIRIHINHNRQRYTHVRGATPELNVKWNALTSLKNCYCSVTRANSDFRPKSSKKSTTPPKAILISVEPDLPYHNVYPNQVALIIFEERKDEDISVTDTVTAVHFKEKSRKMNRWAGTRYSRPSVM